MFGLKSREDQFFKLFNQTADLLCQSTRCLLNLVSDFSPDKLPTSMSKITDLEHQADDVTSRIIDKLNHTMVTPIDREDIYKLATFLDNVIDFIQGAIERMVVYKASTPPQGAIELTKVLDECAKIIKDSFSYLPNIRSGRQHILENVAKVSVLESDADKLYRKEVGRLFDEEKNILEIIKWKEILEHLENAADYCEDIGDFIKGVVLKYA
ncbi:putative phosphate transport regulator [Syntrophobotulus glycolicus DSM 8271]|uniref:Phosphate transport regulator n=1 Tax=Syntrophobotulus glycolicus (strain DSM 8271 / FlGlyR) TaxID=645991 RepID=F0SYD4_SYNGF|nr:DUF47 family protein [Syntrophobotulus glycolicus]ADY55969.1 putative phosphate transport regulator [Syntrophobotulus glycolicus DSM 8271]